MKINLRKSLYAIALTAFVVIQNCNTAHAWIVGMGLTNFDMTLATNSFRIYRTQDAPMIDGTYLVLGSPVTVPVTGGYGFRDFLPGNYELRIVGYTLSKPIYFVLPQGVGSNDVTQLRISGVNFFNYTPRLVYETNASVSANPVASPAVMDFDKPYSAASMGANITLTAPIGVSPYKTTVQWAVRFYTNTTGPLQKTMSFPASWFGNTSGNYITNVSVVSVVVYPGIGTNVTVRHLN